MHKTDIHYWLALKLVPRLASQKKLALVKMFGLQTLFKVPSPLNSSHGLSAKQISAFYQPNWQKVAQIIEASNHCESEIISYNHELYPKPLKQIYDPPLVLFTKGNTHLLNEVQLGIVGSRNATVSGREQARLFARDLVERNLVVTSGLALGIDAAAHKGALQYNASTIAVVATGLDSVYPARHKLLVNQILAQQGLLISEFFPGTPARAGHFPKRNRIISGMSQGVLVVEATIKSGSLITARCALEQNREVFAVPNSIHNEQAKGCHWLIKQGAKLVESCADIVEELNLDEISSLHLKQERQEQLNSQLIQNKEEDKINPQKDLCNDALLASVGFEVTPVDRVVSRSKLPIEEVLTRLTVLELSGLVSAVPGGYLRVK